MKRSAEDEEEEEEIETTKLESVHDVTLRTEAAVRENTIQLGTTPWPDELKFKMYDMSHGGLFALGGIIGRNGEYNVSLRSNRDFAAVFRMLKNLLARFLAEIGNDINNYFHYSYHRVHAREANVGDLHYHINAKYANCIRMRIRMAEALRYLVHLSDIKTLLER